MTTETTPDPTTEAWSGRLEAQLAEAGMEQAQARAYRLAFELGLTRVTSQTATRHEFNAAVAQLRQEIANVRQEIKDAAAGVKRELRFHMLLLAGFLGGLLGGLFALLGVILSKL